MSPTQAHDLVERLYDEHRDAVLRFARSRNYDLADDVVSETFAIALRRADAVPVGRERVWLIGVADNVLRNLQRKEQRAASLPGVLQPHATTSSAPHEPAVVGPAIAELPETERAVLTLTAFEGLSSAEAGQRLGLTPGSTRNAMTRGRRNLALRLAAVGVLVLAPVLFFLSRDRATEPRPPARQLADALRRAAVLTTDVTVHTAGGERGRYRVTLDREHGRTRIELPGGLTARGPIGAPATIVAGPGTTSAARQQARRRHGAALRALQTITSGDLERFLRATPPTPTATRASDDGSARATVVRGPFTTSDGRRVELRVVLGGRPTELRQLRVRPADAPGARWTTVDVSDWSVELPAAQAPARPTPHGTAKPPATATVKPSARTRDHRADPDPDAEAAGRPSRDRTAAESAPGRAPVDRETAQRNRATVASVPTYAGETGPVLHTRSVTISSSRDASTGRITRTQTLEREAWTETGGGRRERTITRALGATSGRLQGVTERWSSPRLWVELPRRGAVDGTELAPSAFCRPPTLPPAGPTPEQQSLQRARTDLASLPPGPELRGHRTRVFTHTAAPAPGAGGVRPPETLFHLDAETGVPLRRTFRGFGSQEVVVRTDYLAWEERPAGSSAAELAGTLPARFRLRQPDRCAAGVTAR